MWSESIMKFAPLGINVAILAFGVPCDFALRWLVFYRVVTSVFEIYKPYFQVALPDTTRVLFYLFVGLKFWWWDPFHWIAGHFVLLFAQHSLVYYWVALYYLHAYVQLFMTAASQSARLIRLVQPLEAMGAGLITSQEAIIQIMTPIVPPEALQALTSILAAQRRQNRPVASDDIDESIRRYEARMADFDVVRPHPPLPSFVMMENSSDMCSVCRDRLVMFDEVTTLRCNHQFHHSCISPWAQQHNECPMCRQGMFDDANADA